MKRYVYTHAYSNIIHNSQKVETFQVSTDRWIEKQNKPSEYYAKWNKPVTKGQILYDSSHMRYLE